MSGHAQSLRQGKVGVIPTDTLYGIVASALNQDAIERVYNIKQRTPTKPPIILISSLDDLALFNITPTEGERTILYAHWPGPVSIILPCDDERFAYLHRGAHSLAFRLPDKADLCALLVESGPLIAPSANPEGLPPAITINEARAYFGDKVDFYIDSGEVAGHASHIIRIHPDGTTEDVRK